MVRRRSTTQRGKGVSRAAELESSVIEERCFVNPSAVSPHLFCPICQEVFCKPQRAPCGHSYCQRCIEPWLKTNQICPIDRKSLSANSMHHDFILESIIGDYTVACPWRPLGCEFIGPLHLLSSHKAGCFMNPKTMPPALQAHSAELLSKATSNLNGISNSAVSNSRLMIPTKCNFNNRSNTISTINLSDDSLNEEVVQGGETDADDVSVIEIPNDDESDLPPAPPPSLRFRIYQNADSGSRSLLCNFLESSSVLPGPAPRAKRGRR